MNIRLYNPHSIEENSTNLLSKEHTHYVVNVMRLKRGSNINFFNSEGEWKSEIVFLDKDRVEVKIIEKIKQPKGLSNIESIPYIVVSIFIHQCYQWFLLKSYEIGDLTKVYPIARGSAPLLTTLVSIFFLGVILHKLIIASIFFAR